MESIEAIHSEAVRMRDLTEQLLMLARRQKDWQLHIESFSLAEVVQKVSQNIENSYGRKVNLTVDEEMPPIHSDQQKSNNYYTFLSTMLVSTVKSRLKSM